MGLDIGLAIKDQETLCPDYYTGETDYYPQHSLSRSFCHFMGHLHLVDDPELTQIGRLTGVDVQPLANMLAYDGEGESVDFHLSLAESEEERAEVLAQHEETERRITGNLDRVLHTVNALLERLAPIDNLYQQLEHPQDYPLWDAETYFADFNTDKGDGYLDNNLGQDLRNFRRFLEYAQSCGGQSVYFYLG